MVTKQWSGTATSESYITEQSLFISIVRVFAFPVSPKPCLQSLL